MNKLINIFKRKNKDRLGVCPVCGSLVPYNGIKLKLMEKYIPNFNTEDIKIKKCLVCKTDFYEVKRRY